MAAMICSENRVASRFMSRELSAARAVSSGRRAHGVERRAHVVGLGQQRLRGVRDRVHAELGGVLELVRHVDQIGAAIGLTLAVDVDDHEVAPMLLAQEVGQPVDARQQPFDLVAMVRRRSKRRIELGPRNGVERLACVVDRRDSETADRAGEAAGERHAFATGSRIGPARHRRQATATAAWRRANRPPAPPATAATAIDDKSFRNAQTLHAPVLGQQAGPPIRRAIVPPAPPVVTVTVIRKRLVN